MRYAAGIGGGGEVDSELERGGQLWHVIVACEHWQ